VVPALIGRTRECRQLGELLDDARDGRARVLVLRGEHGIGKTALLQHLIVAAEDFTIAQAAGVECEMELPFAALQQLCAPMLDRLAELPEPQRDAAATAFGLTFGTSPDRLLIGLAVLNLLSRVSDGRPLLCVVDDAHWLDRGSVQALAFVARRLLADRVALVFATCTPIDDLAHLRELFIEGLADADAQSLLSSMLRGRLDERVRDRIVTESGGNPLALIEWPQRPTAAGLAGGFAVPNGLARTSKIEATFRQRLAELPDSTRRLLTVAAAEPTGDPIIVLRAARALGIAPVDATPAVDAGLLDIGVRVAFRHPLVRTSSYAMAPLGDRQAAHRALAAATDPDLDPDRRAWHRALGSPGPDEEVAEALERSAGRARARGGLAATAALLERSVALTVVPSRRTDRMLASAEAHLESGSFELAARLLAAAEASPLDEMGRARLELLRARNAVYEGDRLTAPALFMRAARRLESIDLNLAFTTHLMAMGAAAMTGLGAGVTLRDAATAAMASPRSHQPTELERLAIALATASVHGPAAAAPLLREILSTADSTLGADAYRWSGYMVAAAAIVWDFDEYSKYSTAQVRLARDAGALSLLPVALNTLAGTFVLQGDLDAAASAVREATEILSATGTNLVIALGTQHAALEAADGAERRIDEHVEAARVAGAGNSLRAALWARATLGNATGDYDKALASSSEAIEQPWAWTELNFHEHVEAAVRCGQRDAAAATLHRIMASTTASGTDWALGIERRCQALISADVDADDLYRQATHHLRRTRLRPELARTHLLYGEWLRRSNRRLDARAELQTAYDMFDSMGINAFGARCRRELLSTGAAVRKRTLETYGELTTQELEVSRLALDGFTNAEIGARLFISDRTAEWHLRNVFIKLGISSRRELEGTLPTRGQLAAPNAG
jgi:DNA-binding CsgD family transcriptional regulator